MCHRTPWEKGWVETALLAVLPEEMLVPAPMPEPGCCGGGSRGAQRALCRQGGAVPGGTRCRRTALLLPDPANKAQRGFLLV